MRKPFSALPQSVFVENKEYPINTDFKLWIKIYSDLENKALSYEEKILSLLVNGYKRELPPHIDLAINALMDFMAQGKSGGSTDNKKSERVLDFSCDEGLIYAGFMSEYRIDLYNTELHWWQFMSLLNGLSEGCALMRVVSYRSINCEEIKNKEIKKHMRKMKNRYRLKDNIGEEQIADTLEMIML